MFSRHKKGHGIHSPAVYSFIKEVLNREISLKDKKQLELYYNQVRNISETIEVNDFGAGSRVHKSNCRKISAVAKYSSITPKFGKILYHICRVYSTSSILELGTCLGVGTFYLAKGNPKIKVVSIEGCENLFRYSKNKLNEFEVMNVILINNQFDLVINDTINKYQPSVFYIDGNHKKEATLRYFDLCSQCGNNDKLIIIDDINWSNEMREAWKMIKRNDRSRITIDLFKLGIVFLGTGFTKKNYIIRY